MAKRTCNPVVVQFTGPLNATSRCEASGDPSLPIIVAESGPVTGLTSSDAITFHLYFCPSREAEGWQGRSLASGGKLCDG